MSMHSIFIKEIERLRRLLIGIGISYEDVEDILQEVYLEALQKPPKHGDTQENARWLMKVTINKCMLEFRQKRQNQRAEKEIPQRRADLKKIQPAPDCKVIHNEETQAMRHCLNEMDESLKIPLVMKYFCDLNSSQISEILALKPGTVRKRLCQGRLILAELLLKKGIKP
jgi:RNA polymerase sigma factor (sigma-70 family)